MDCSRQASNKLPKKDSDKQLCTMYIKCTISGKCDYEVATPRRSCQRRHECSWCRQKLGQGNKHQEWECCTKNDNGDWLVGQGQQRAYAVPGRPPQPTPDSLVLIESTNLAIDIVDQTNLELQISSTGISNSQPISRVCDLQNSCLSYQVFMSLLTRYYPQWLLSSFKTHSLQRITLCPFTTW